MNRSQYEETLRERLTLRAGCYNKAGSVSHKHDEIHREAVKDTWLASAEKVTESIIDLIVAEFPDQRPAPRPEFEYNGKRMVIQRYDGVTTWYVSEDTFNPDLYEYKQQDYRQHIEQQISRH